MRSDVSSEPERAKETKTYRTTSSMPIWSACSTCCCLCIVWLKANASRSGVHVQTTDGVKQTDLAFPVRANTLWRTGSSPAASISRILRIAVSFKRKERRKRWMSIERRGRNFPIKQLTPSITAIETKMVSVCRTSEVGRERTYASPSPSR